MLWFAVLAIVAVGSAAEADTHYVDPSSSNPTEPYASRETAARDIQSAVNAAEAGDTVQVAAGTYRIEKTISVGKAVTVQGAGADKTTIDAQGKCRVVTVGGGATLKGVTVTGGKSREGAGVGCGAGATVAECTITGNTAERYGGGISCRKGAGTTTVVDCKIIKNQVTQFWHTDYPFGGGGIYAEGSVVVRNCRIEGNESAQRGGGIWLHGGGTVAENCVIVGNRAYGKRRNNPNGPGSMEEGGGGAFCDFGAGLQNCLIIDNRSDKIAGGAILSTGARAIKCTVVGNTASLRGGGLMTLGVARVLNSIAYGNTQGSKTAPDPSDLYVSHYYHVDIHQLTVGKVYVSNSCIGSTKLHTTNQRFYLGRTAGWDPNWYRHTVNRTKCIEKDPQFIDAAKGDYRLKDGSPGTGMGASGPFLNDTKSRPTTRPAQTATPAAAPTKPAPAATKAATAPAKPKPLRILFVGNSYIYFNELPMMLDFMSKQSGKGGIEAALCSPGGCTFAGHCGQGERKSPALKLIDRGRYDYVVLQEEAQVPYKDHESMFKYGRILNEHVRKSGAKTMLFVTWAHKNHRDKQPAITAAYTKLARESGAYLVPVGVAWEKAIKAYPQVSYYRSDNVHPQRVGTYLAACVFYSVIYGVSPEGLPERINVKRRGKYTVLAHMGKPYALFLQKLAWQTVQSLNATKPMPPQPATAPQAHTSKPYYVDPSSSNPTEPYASRETAARDIQSAVNAAQAGDTVQVAAGTYRIDKTISVGKAVTVQGAGADKSTIDAGGNCRAVVLGGGATLKGFTITGGKAREGAGVQCGAGAKLLECTISNNTAERYGGGVCARGAGKQPALVADCIIRDNKVTRFMHTDTPWGGGGLYIEPGTTVRNCRIENNEAAQRAGGVWAHYGGALVENCTIVGNRALGRRARNPNGPGSMNEGGGGAYCDFGGRLRNCLIQGNSAPIGGGAVLSQGGNIRSCTVVGNTASISGGGVQTLGVAGVVNSIIHGNTQSTKKQPDDLYVSHYYHVDVHQLTLGKPAIRNCCVGSLKLHHTRQRFYLGPTAGYNPNNYKNVANQSNCIDKDPQFVDAAGSDYRLKPSSPCINAALKEPWMEQAKDLDGKDRVRGDAPDIGAYEAPASSK